ncbi:MAG: hypothetical protein BAJALOKI1v1_280017 [Promethearchaeota archaeon]|nr:MAG: hypothetical protein BAJALOKI1v1_280017 [Candidatus Lokiarchaeota archaeon]
MGFFGIFITFRGFGVRITIALKALYVSDKQFLIRLKRKKSKLQISRLLF